MLFGWNGSKRLWGLLCSLLFGLLAAVAQLPAEVIPLDAGWEFSRAGVDVWREAVVPGTVCQDLIRYGDVPDPFYGTNEDSLRWVEEEDWEYRLSFEVTARQLERDGALLVLEGLDTYADVYLNGSLLVRSDNMFVGHVLSVKDVLRPGQNRLHVYFRSPIRQVFPQYASNGFNYPADNDHREEHLSVFTRKAPYSYGWDWGIRLVTSGIWKSVRLCFFDVAVADDYVVRQLSLTDTCARLCHELTVDCARPLPVEAEVVAEASFAGKVVAVAGRQVTLQPGKNCLSLPMEIVRPHLWMPNGWGEAYLYDMSVQVRCGGTVVAGQSHRIGLRTVRVLNEPDTDGVPFCFEVNGVPLFVKGANYIPQDALPSAVSDERYRALFREVKDAHMNMLRVWGGGIYERDLFYELADELGILVWQDFQFACTPYPSDLSFLRNVEREADWQIRRLRHHACLAMWCGNNEVEEALKYWGYDKRYAPEVYKEMLRGYDRLFRKLLPGRVDTLDKGRFYLHGSPAFANWGRRETWRTGDCHNWGVWYGQKPFESLDTDSVRFMSEFGFQAFPEMKTIRTFAAPADYRIDSPVMRAHQKSSIGNELIHTYMERDYRLPRTFEDFVYVGLVLQGQGIRRGLEAHRRMRPYCMGTLYWQLNDSWPVVSWSGIDYYGNRKALHYQAKRAFAPVLVSAVSRQDSLAVYLVSDRLDTLRHLTLEYEVRDFAGKSVGQKRTLPGLTLPANTALCLHWLPLDGWLTPAQRRTSYLLLTLKERDGACLARTVYYFEKPKELELPMADIRQKVRVREGECELTLSSAVLAKDVFVEVPFQGASFTDNFFDLLPGEPKTVIIRSPEIRKGTPVPVTLHHLRQTYE